MKCIIRALPSWLVAIGFGSAVLLINGLNDKTEAARDIQARQKAHQATTQDRPKLLKS